MRKEKRKKLQCLCGCGLGLVRGTCCLFWGGFSSVSASESECQQIRRFSIDSMCRNSQFTFLSLSLFLFSLSHTLFLSQHYLLIHPSIDLLPQKCVQSTPHHQPHRPDPEIHLDELGPKQKTPSGVGTTIPLPPRQRTKTERQEQIFKVFTSHLYHLEKWFKDGWIGSLAYRIRKLCMWSN